ncbi:MAG TPA: amino acid adenylation domain-containing protein [Pyrinomonadaceae bacterium]|nr:amino acid adenylation domain-containing protein [Pyrinomonadaceae bacterium]
MPGRRVRPASNEVSAATEQRVFPEQLCSALQRLSRQRGVTTFMTLLAAFQTLLHRYTGLDDIVVGTPVANRTRIETESLIGFFANTLVLRGDVSGDPSFDDLLARVRTLTLEAHAHQDVPFELLVEELQPERDLNRTPLFQIMLVMQNTPSAVIDLPGVRVEQLELDSTAPKFDLILFLKESDGGLIASWEYNPTRFDAETIKGLASHFETLLESAVADPHQRISRLKMLSDDERLRVVTEFNTTAVEYPRESGMHELFEAQVARTPRATALVHNNERLSYEELNERANQLAHYLSGLGVGPETLVGVLLERSPLMIVAMLGVLKSGGAYVPLDSSYPRERLQFTLKDARAHVLLTQADWLDALPDHEARLLNVVCLDKQWPEIAGERTDNLPQSVADNALAYVIYTSGSTGRPKGVAIEHRSVVAFLHWAKEQFSTDHLAGVLASTSICFDLSVFEIFVPLSVGGKIILAANALELPSLTAAREVTLINTVPSAMTELVRLNALPESVRVVNLAGEPLQNVLVQSVYAHEQIEQVLNLYGPSEDTTYSTWTQIEKGSEEAPTIGRPVANTQAYLLDAHLHLTPIGVAGELYLGGFGLARGYLNRPELTAERFVPDPFSGAPDGRLYRTGDLARYLPDGRLEYLGRLDHQLKLRGFRIELGEIETVLRDNSTVRDAVVVAHETDTGDKQLVAYVVAANSHVPTTKELRIYLQERLPKYMVPAFFVALDELPLTPNGKVDRRALPAPAEIALEPTLAHVTPRTHVEKELAQVWQQLLNRSRVGIHDNFFELGGHSLLATQVISRVRERFKIEIPLRSIFEASTIADLAERIEHSLGAAVTSPIPRTPRDTALPLSFAQQRLWFLDQVVPGNPAYNIQAAVRLSGSLNVAAFRATLNQIVQRHEILRTTFVMIDGLPAQVVGAIAEVPLEVRDLSTLPLFRQGQAVQRLASEEARKPFDLTQGPLLRATLLPLTETEHVLLLSMHHIVADGWSIGVLVQEVAALYPALLEAKPAPLAELPIQYADFAVWQRQWLQGEVLHEQLDYWLTQLAGLKPLELPTDHPRPPVQSFRGARRFFSLPAELSNELRALSEREGVTLYMTLLAAWQTLLHRYTRQNEIVTGTDIANRNRSEIENLIGFFTNQLVLRADFSGNPTFKELLRRTREVTLGAYAHQDLPFEKLVEVLQLERTLDRNPLFQVMFVFQNTPMPDLELPGLSMRAIEIDEGTTAFDLTLTMEETDKGIRGSMRYSTDLFDGTTIERMVKHLENLLHSIVVSVETSVQALEMHDADERQQAELRKKERTTSRLKKLTSVKPRAVTFSGEALFKTSYLEPDQRLPLVIQSSFAEVDLATWAKRYEQMIETELLRHGAILFRGFNVNSIHAFEEFTRAASQELVEYGERSSPRTQLSPGIYTSTDHPADQHIVLHNEQSYTLNWPMKIWFCCQQPAPEGGQTPIADSREIYRRLDPALIRLFEKKSVMYVRNYGDGLGLPWQEVFQTTSREDVEEHCSHAAIECEWKDGDRLCTRQVRPAVRIHPKTGEWVWFNHALFFHVSSLDAATQAAFAGLTADELPFNTLFGDATPIDQSLMQEIAEAYKRQTVSFPWQTGDVLMLDNMLVAHGREPFTGPRKVIVAMADPFQSIYVEAEVAAAAHLSV